MNRARLLLLRGGHLPEIGRSGGEEIADILVRDGLIAAIGPDLEAGDAEILDVRGDIVMPGFVDTHRHAWQTPFRGIAADWSHGEYLRRIRGLIGPRCSAEDVYAGNYLGALDALDAGVTTMLDFAHCVNSSEHADAALQGLRDAGGRAVFAYGYLPTLTAEPAFADHRRRLEDARRIRAQMDGGDDALVTMGVALADLGLVPFEQTIAEVRSAREMEVPTVLHSGCTWGLRVTHGVAELAHHDLLGPDQVHVHCNALDERDLRRLAEHDCKVSSSPETEMQMGMGHPVLGRAMAAGMHPSLSCDVISANSGDMFAQMRLALQFERCMHNDRLNAENRMPERLHLSVRDALAWATVNGARALGLEDRIGTLAVGMRADLIVVGHERLHLTPMADPSGCLVTQASAADVKHVLVDGRIRKRDGELCGVDVGRARELGEAACESVMRRITDEGLELESPPIPGLEDAVNTLASQHLAQAWTMEARG